MLDRKEYIIQKYLEVAICQKIATSFLHINLSIQYKNHKIVAYNHVKK